MWRQVRTVDIRLFCTVNLNAVCAKLRHCTENLFRQRNQDNKYRKYMLLSNNLLRYKKQAPVRTIRAGA